MATTHHCQSCKKNGFCKSHQVRCPIHPKVFYYSENSNGYPKKCRQCDRAPPTAVEEDEGPELEADKPEKDTRRSSAKLLAIGGYNAVYLVQLREPIVLSQPTGTNNITRFILRLPCEDALLPYQVANDVAFKKYIALKLPHIPVPEVYYFQATDETETSFTVEEYIDCPTLSSKWMSLELSQKDKLAHTLAKIAVDLSEVRFDFIGGIEPSNYSPAPTVEGCKIFKGRHKFHWNNCYSIGPYKSTKDYVVSSYDREIYYYLHAQQDIDKDLFSVVSVEQFVEGLRNKRESLANANIVDEPFVLVHGDFHGRNILVRGDEIAAIIDWDFAGAYPLSESLSWGDIEVVESETEAQFEESSHWGFKIRQLIQQEAKKRNWDQTLIDLMMSDGNPELSNARVEMIPEEF